MDQHTCTLVNTRTLFEANNQAPVHTFENVARTPNSLQSIEHFIAHERARKFDCRHYRRNVNGTHQHLEPEPESFAAEQHLWHIDVWVMWQSLPQVQGEPSFKDVYPVILKYGKLHLRTAKSQFLQCSVDIGGQKAHIRKK